MTFYDLIKNYIQKRVPEDGKIIMGTMNITEETATFLKKENVIHKKIIIEWEEMDISELKGEQE